MLVLEAPEPRSEVETELAGGAGALADEPPLPEVLVDKVVGPGGETGLGPLPLVQSPHGRPPVGLSALALFRTDWVLARARGVRSTS